MYPGYGAINQLQAVAGAIRRDCMLLLPLPLPPPPPPPPPLLLLPPPLLLLRVSGWLACWLS
jgi:hypothetical protein